MEPTSVELNTSTNTKESKEKEKEAIPSAAKPDEQSAAVIKRLLELHPNGPPEDPAVDHYYVLVELEIEKVGVDFRFQFYVISDCQFFFFF